MKKLTLMALIFTVLALWGCQAGQTNTEAYSANYFDFFDTITNVTIYTDSQEKFDEYNDALVEKMEYYNQLYDIYNSYEGVVNVRSINDSAGIAPVAVEPELFSLLEFCTDEYYETSGRVNIAMGSVLSIWHEYREGGSNIPGGATVPDMAELEKANQYTDITDMILDPDNMQVYLTDKHMSLDVGAIGKGYATQKAADMLREMGVTSGLLSVGGDIVAIGPKGDGTPWRIGIQNPDLTSSRAYLHVVEVEDKSVVTSGTYQRYYEVDGVRYHHIIHPDLLYPWNEYQSVTIIADDGGLADAYSTAVFNMDLDEGIEFIEARDGVEAMWILDDDTEVFSSGFADYMTE